jgi:hypothetical protein
MWLQDPREMDVNNEDWNIPCVGSSFYIWESKLRITKKQLKEWANEHF